MKTKPTIRCHLTLVRMAIVQKSANNKCWRGWKTRECSYTFGGTVNWYSHYGEQYGVFFKKLKIELPYDPAIPLLGVYLEKNMSWKDTWIPMFTAALFTITKTGKWPKCPSKEERIKKMWYTYTMEYYSATEKNEIMTFAATWMDLETLMLNEVNQTKKEKYHMISFICGI